MNDEPNIAIERAAIEHSKDYEEVLRMDEIDLNNALSPSDKRKWDTAAHLEVDDERFKLVIVNRRVRAAGWKTLFLAYADNAELNRSAGVGTSRVNIVKPYWHWRILEELRETLAFTTWLDAQKNKNQERSIDWGYMACLLIGVLIGVAIRYFT